MNVRRLDENGDYIFGRPTSRLYDADAVYQLTLTNLRLTRGEWFLDTTAGVAWYDRGDGGPYIFGQMADPGFAESDIKRVMLSTNGVGQLLSFSLTLDHSTRRSSVVANLVTVYGEATQIQAVLP